MKELTMIEQHILLSIFQLHKNAYLVTIREHIKNITGKDMAIATIYVPLERLSRLGYLSTRLVKPAPRVGGRAIKYYRLTQAGIRTLDEMKRIQERFWVGYSKKTARD
jgi:DNA-binding PadR family transcriptional regulator